MFNGRYTDYNKKWYTHVGYMIYQTYFVQIFMPYFWLGLEYVYYMKLFHYLDTGCSFD
jgi:hypothetical protein